MSISNYTAVQTDFITQLAGVKPVDVSLTHSFALIDSVRRFITKRYGASVSSDSTSAPSMTPGLWTIVWIPAVIFSVSHALIGELPGLILGLFIP